MFRSLATRLTATFVFGAFVLVVIAVAAITFFMLTMFGVSARDEMAAVTREAPDFVRAEMSHTGSLDASAPEIVRGLWRPGVHLALFAKLPGNGRIPLAWSGGEGPDGRPVVVRPPKIRMSRTGPVALMPPKFSFGTPDRGAFDQGPGPSGGDRSPDGPPGGPEFGRGPDGGPVTFAFGRPGSDRFFRGRQFPFGLNGILHLDPVNVDVNGGYLAVSADPGPFEHAINMFWLTMIPVGIFSLVAAWMFGRFITLSAMRPLVETTASLERFGAGDFTPHAVVTAERNEIGSLVTAYNKAASQVARALAEREAAEEQMRQFVADAGHELRTPLTVIMGFIDVLRKRAVSESATSVKIYDTMLDESRRMKELIDKLIVLARLENQPQNELQTVDLAEVAEHVVTSLSALRPSPPIAFAQSGDSLVRGNESELHDALTNLVENAVKYAPDSPVDVRVRGENGVALVEVIDQGPGIAPEEQAQVFDRFYRGKDRGEQDGFGLGLAIAKRAVERAGGEITLASALGKGSRFSIRIPLATAP